MNRWMAIVCCVVISASVALASDTFAETKRTVSAPSQESAGTPGEGVEEGEADEEPAVFTEEYLNDPESLAAGKELWQDTCRHCHGRAAYPGKAPKLRPRRYTPEFVFDRVTNGFRKMPGWKDVFTKEERMSIVAYVLSRSFSP